MDIAFADLAKAATIRWRRGELDLAGVLDRQYVTIARRNPGLAAPALDQLVDGDARIVHKPPIPHLRRPQPLRHPPQAHAARAKHGPQQRPPPVSRRLSPNSPSDRSCSNRMASAPSNQRQQRINRLAARESEYDLVSQSAAIRCVDALARRRGR